MTGDVLRLGRLLARLARRERALLALRSVRRGAGLVAVASIAFAWSVRAGVAPGVVVFAGVLAAGIGAWWAALPVLAAWSRAADPRRQARAVEVVVPGLRGRLDTAASYVGSDVPVPSDALLALSARRALVALTPWPASRLRPLAPAAVATAGTVVPGLVVAAVALATSLPVLGAWWATRLGADLEPIEAAEVYGRFGNIDLVLVPPAYTGLPEQRLDNTDGTIEALPGTHVKVSARSALPHEAVAVVVGESPAKPAKPLGPNSFVADLVVGDQSTTWFLLGSGAAGTSRSKAFPMIPRADHPPDVALTGGPIRLEVGADDPILLAWTVTDDFGIARVDLVLDQGEGFLIGAPWGAGRSLEGAVELTPRDLGLAPGREVDLRVVAWDNDAVAGAKAGHSAPLRLSVLGGVEPTELARWRAARDALVLALADDLMETWPPDLRAWPAALEARHAALAADHRHDALGSYVESVLGHAEMAAAYARSLAGSRVGNDEIGVLTGLRDDLVERTEYAALAADRQVVGAALIQAEDAAYFASQHAADLVAVLDRDDMGGVHGLLDRLEPELARVEASLADLPDGPLRDQSSLAVGHARALATVLASGAVQVDPNLARDPADHLARVTRELHADLAEALDGYSRREEEQQERLKKLIERLDRLAIQERLLAGQVHALLAVASEPLAAQWAAAADTARRLGADPTPMIAEVIEHLQGSIERQDADHVAVEVVMLSRRSEIDPMSVDPAALALLQRQSTEILAAKAAASRPDGMQAHVPTQDAARAEAVDIAGLVPELDWVPEGPRAEAAAHLDRAADAMQAANGALTDERGGAAEAAMEDAAAEVEAARDILKRYVKPCDSCGTGACLGGACRGGRDDKCSRRSRNGWGDVWIPPPDRSPEEYRRLLLEGMAGPVPEAYEALSTRYYEELVRP